MKAVISAVWQNRQKIPAADSEFGVEERMLRRKDAAMLLTFNESLRKWRAPCDVETTETSDSSTISTLEKGMPQFDTHSPQSHQDPLDAIESNEETEETRTVFGKKTKPL